jgi:hypothetical protein
MSLPEILVHPYNSWFLKHLHTDSFSLKSAIMKIKQRNAGERRPYVAGAREKEE